uniref:C2H2-type domain-containing protein n=1 Tax=Oreochromis aureus TaxID=47969 RepID=A0A668RVC0_OREAU
IQLFSHQFILFYFGHQLLFHSFSVLVPDHVYWNVVRLLGHLTLSSHKNQYCVNLDKKATIALNCDDGPFSCTICGQVFPQVLLLKSHMKRHRGAQDHGCRICGRRFRQAWFLQSHMRIHRVKAQLRGSKSNEPPATINGVPQDPASLTNEECLYELCAGCGNFFNDRRTLQIHEKLHKLNHTRTQMQNPTQGNVESSEVQDAKRQFLESLNLTSAGARESPEEVKLGSRIPELDPICSYQSWQLATRGRLPNDTAGSNLKKKKGDTGLDHKGGDKKISQKDPILLNGLGQAFYEALQTKNVKDVHSSSKQTKNIRSLDQEGEPNPPQHTIIHYPCQSLDKSLYSLIKLRTSFCICPKTDLICYECPLLFLPADKKKYFCEHCDFHTVDTALLRSHLHTQHQDFLSSYSKQSTNLDISRSGSKASRYMDYLRSRSILLSQPYWNPYSSSPSQELVESNIKMEKTNGSEVKEQGHATGDASSLLNLSSLPITDVSFSVKTQGLVRHQCPYCSHTTNYPEVLWIHQRVAHRVDGSSTMAPKWAPSINSLKSLKAGASQWRRTGPPPFLEGKDCPALPTPRTQRTQPPGVTNHGGSSSNKQSSHKNQSGTLKSKHQSKDSRPSDATQCSGKVGLQNQKKEHNRTVEGGSKGSSTQATSSNSIVNSKSLQSLQPTSSPKQRGNRATVEGNFPQEGLGFMLARSRSGNSSSSSNTDKLHSRRHSSDFSSGPKGSDLWAAMNMWGLHGSKAYLDTLRRSQGKSESTGETPTDIDILSLLKNYSPHDLAALYQHWGFVDPRLVSQGKEEALLSALFAVNDQRTEYCLDQGWGAPGLRAGVLQVLDVSLIQQS